ncbi:hypothetical protein V5T82_08855 [Magnetovibrio sp. PR-2]|uniref:hypothetical protein n=1 Tax=Magnetovibrio sp. PR-2 TaxID=3120356 RepID=UPI002FCE4CA0
MAASHEHNVVAICHDPGGANMLLPVIEEMQQRGEKLTLIARGPGAAIWADGGMPLHSDVVGKDDLQSLIVSLQPNLLLTGTSMSESSEYGSDIDRDTWDIGRKMGVKTVAGVDASMNLELRFLHNVDKGQYYPEVLCLNNDATLASFKDLDLKDAKAHVVGQPHLEKTAASLKSLRKGFKKNKPPIVVFFSEPVNLGLPISAQPGFDEFDVATHVINAVQDENLRLFIKPHPHEDVDVWQNFINAFPIHSRLEISIETASPMKLYSIADVVLGIGSSVLMEASLAAIPTAALQPDRKVVVNSSIDENPAIEKLYSRQTIEQDLQSFVKSPKSGGDLGQLQLLINGSCNTFADCLTDILVGGQSANEVSIEN